MDLIDRSQSRGKNSVGPIGARHRRYVWNSCCGPHLGSGHVRPHQQTGHMAAIASIRNRIPPLASRGPSTYGSRLKAGTTEYSALHERLFDHEVTGFVVAAFEEAAGLEQLAQFFQHA